MANKSTNIKTKDIDSTSECSTPANEGKSTKQRIVEKKRQVKQFLEKIKIAVPRLNPIENNLVLKPILPPVTQGKVQIPQIKLYKRKHLLL